MRMRLKKSHGVAVAVVGALLAYQNCAQVQSSTEDSDGIPFAYDAKPDTMAYMSCSEITGDMSGVNRRRAYFSFRMGAYTPGVSGVTLNNTFRKLTATYTPEVRAQTLESSALNGNTRLSFSFRKRKNIQAFWSEVPGLKTSIDGFLPPMDAAEVAGPLSSSTATAGVYRNYFPSANEKRVMEASLNVLGAEADARKIRGNLQGADDPTYLVMGYSGTSDELDMSLRTPPEAVAGATTQAYGLAFQPAFGTFRSTSGEPRLLTGLTEYDLTTSPTKVKSDARWTCPESLQFMIVRPEDLASNPNLCRPGPDLEDDKQTLSLKQIRRVLRAEDWYVDLDPNRRCIVPKNTADICYGSTLGGRRIRYREAGCSFNATDGTTCAHWVSVCVRNQQTE